MFNSNVIMNTLESFISVTVLDRGVFLYNCVFIAVINVLTTRVGCYKLLYIEF